MEQYLAEQSAKVEEDANEEAAEADEDPCAVNGDGKEHEDGGADTSCALYAAHPARAQGLYGQAGVRLGQQLQLIAFSSSNSSSWSAQDCLDFCHASKWGHCLAQCFAA